MISIYFILCLLQPICLLVPEIVTVLWGVERFGPTRSFIVGVIGMVIGIAIMYACSTVIAEWMISKFHYEKYMEIFYSYVKQYHVLIVGVLFVIPILPDEIIGIGAPLVGIGFGQFISIAIFSKIVSVGMISFSSQIASVCALQKWQIIMLELLILYLASIIVKNNNREAKGA